MVWPTLGSRTEQNRAPQGSHIRLTTLTGGMQRLENASIHRCLPISHPPVSTVSPSCYDKQTEDRDNGESTSMVWSTLGSRTAEEQNRTVRSGVRISG